MQRTYRQRKYYCGEYLEVEIFPVYTKAKGRGKRRKPTSDTQQRLNQRHAEGKLRRLLHTNFTPSDLFVTLTFDDARLPASVEDAQRTIQNFLRRLKRRYAKLARDVALLKERGFRLQNAMAADLFPRCSHVESIVTLIR